MEVAVVAVVAVVVVDGLELVALGNESVGMAQGQRVHGSNKKNTRWLW